MKRCQRCNLNFPDSLKFCEACRGALNEVASPSCPACGAVAQPGWKFCVKCRSPLMTAGPDNPSSSTSRPVPPPTLLMPTPTTTPSASTQSEAATASPQPTMSPRQANVTIPQIRVRCRSCRKLVDEDSEFCEFCGANMFEETVTSGPSESPAPLSQPQPTPPADSGAQEWNAAPDRYQEPYRPAPPPTSYTPTPAPSHISTPPRSNSSTPLPGYSPTPPAPPASQPSADKTAPTLSMLSSYGAQEDVPPAAFRWWHGLILLVFFLIFVGGLGAGGWWWWSSRSSASQSNAAPSPSSSPASGSITEANSKSAGPSADDEFKALRDRRMRAQPSEGPQVVAALEEAEKKYRNDYRFPYERAKLSIKGVISHHEAFEALFLAAEKAIDNGKAQDMLNDLMSDKDGDFYKTSRGHHEWEVLIEALKNNDKAHLKAGGH